MLVLYRYCNRHSRTVAGDTFNCCRAFAFGCHQTQRIHFGNRFVRAGKDHLREGCVLRFGCCFQLECFTDHKVQIVFVDMEFFDRNRNERNGHIVHRLENFGFFVVDIFVAVIIRVVFHVAVTEQARFCCRMLFQRNCLTIQFCMVMLAIGHKLKGRRLVLGFWSAVFNLRCICKMQPDLIFRCRLFGFFIPKQTVTGSTNIVLLAAVSILGRFACRDKLGLMDAGRRNLHRADAAHKRTAVCAASDQLAASGCYTGRFLCDFLILCFSGNMAVEYNHMHSFLDAMVRGDDHVGFTFGQCCNSTVVINLQNRRIFCPEGHVLEGRILRPDLGSDLILHTDKELYLRTVQIEVFFHHNRILGRNIFCFCEGSGFFIIHILVAVLVSVVFDIAVFFDRGFLRRMHFKKNGFSGKLRAIMLTVRYQIKRGRLIAGFQTNVFLLRRVGKVQCDFRFSRRLFSCFIFEKAVTGRADIVGGVAICFFGRFTFRNEFGWMHAGRRNRYIPLTVKLFAAFCTTSHKITNAGFTAGRLL